MLDVGSTDDETLLYIMQEFSRDDHKGSCWPYSHYLPSFGLHNAC